MLLAITSLLPVSFVRAGTVNIDFQGIPNTTASAKGALGTETYWNDVQSVNTFNLRDDRGNVRMTADPLTR